ncbi:Piwi domain-containing protein [Xylariaceae sp. FL1272]|nr:Piwi domain-containing protein [Xylariaceae sp. FL1272]
MDKVVQEFLANNGGIWLYDGHKLAWSSKPIREARMKVDLDRDHPDPRRRNNRGVYYVMIKPTTKVRLDYLESYLKGAVAWDEHVLQAMNFLDHCMRQGPSERMLAIKRNFYPKNSRSTTTALPYLEIRQGFSSAFRLGESIRSKATGLMLNVDVANTAFWQPLVFSTVAMKLMEEGNPNFGDRNRVTMPDLIKGLRPVRNSKGNWVMSSDFQLMSRLDRVKFTVTHRNKQNNDRVYVCRYLLFEKEYGAPGFTAHTHKFDWKQPDGSVRNISIYQYFRERYNITLRWPDLPLVHTDKGGKFPMEVCTIAENHRYPYKLNGDQTSTMINFAVSIPQIRKEGIMKGIQELGVETDPYLREFGIKVDPNMKVTEARLLKNPEIVFGGPAKEAKEDPKMKGRWRIDKKKFLEPNRRELTAWGFVLIGKHLRKDQVESFATKFVQIYRGHGGIIRANPAVVQIDVNSGFADFGDYCDKGRQKVMDHFKLRPDFLFFIVHDHNSLAYERIKKSMDCRFVTPSQVLQDVGVRKMNEQYISNVAMKVNAKLGGATCKVVPSHITTYFSKPTMIIGADVSHPGAGSKAPSMAAMSMSMDRLATRYSGVCQTNSYRTEIIIKENLSPMLKRHMIHWRKVNNCYPQHVYYFRDGVDEGSFGAVLKDEIGGLEDLFNELEIPQPKMTVVIATKRHHIRFFPKKGDRATSDENGNPLPGTLVERDCTHPHHFDFYLSSHKAIQGTARPVHYQVIRDDVGVAPNDLQKMVYEHCYQYCRSTTSVSLFPAVYYAHLISNRARSHENIYASQRELPQVKAGHPIGKRPEDIYTDATRHQPGTAAPPLVKMTGDGEVIGNPEDVEFMNTTMWYV